MYTDSALLWPLHCSKFFTFANLQVKQGNNGTLIQFQNNLQLLVRARMQTGGQVLIELAGQNVPLHFHTSMVYSETKLHGQVMTGYICWKKPNVAITENLMLNVFKLIGVPALTGNALIQVYHDKRFCKCDYVFFLSLTPRYRILWSVK